MRKKAVWMVLTGMAVFFLAACYSEQEATGASNDPLAVGTASVSLEQQEDSAVSETSSASLGYEQITPQQAKALMDTETGYVILDVRSQSEYAMGHIDGALLIPDYEVADRAQWALPDKEQLILVYCRTGRRSKLAAEVLVSLGYTNVKEFGGIYDWPYEIVT